jgi:molybdopterin synthase sulfur carrier subunit
MSVTVLYFASLRDAAGCASETVAPTARLGELYDALRARHGFVLPRERVRVARNGDFATWDDRVGDGDEIAFLPPVSGG